MLAPDKDVAIANLSGLVRHNARAMLWAQLVAKSGLPPLSSPPPWFSRLKERLSDADSAAVNWLSADGPRLLAAPPDALIRYGRLFIEVTPELERAVSPSRDGRTPLSDADRENATALVSALLEEAQASRAQMRNHIEQLRGFQHAMTSRQKDLDIYRSMAAQSQSQISDSIKSVQQEVVRLREILAANEVEYEGAKTGFASTSANIIYAVTVAPVFAAGALSAGVALSLASMGLTIYKLEKYTAILRENSAKVTAALRRIRGEEYEILLLSSIIDRLISLSSAAERANDAVVGLDSDWNQTIADLAALKETLSIPGVGADRLSKLYTLQTSAATWKYLIDSAEKIRSLQFQSETITITPH